MCMHDGQLIHNLKKTTPASLNPCIMTSGNAPKYYKRQHAVAGGICITGLLQIIFIEEYRHIGLYWLLLPSLTWLAVLRLRLWWNCR